MPIIDNDYKKYNINKLPRNKYERGNATSVVTIGGSSSTSTQSTINTGNFIGRNLWGQYFDDTQDINGTMYVEGSVNVKEDVNVSGTLGVGASGSWDAESQTIESPDAYFWHATIDDLEGGTADINELNANYITSNYINNSGKIDTNELEAQSLTAAQGYIHTLTSDNIWTKDLTVAGSAHFFELVIDKIKSTGGATLLTPADGFKIQYVDYEHYSYNDRKRLFFLAENDGKKIHNMWEVGDYAIIQNFNKAVSGTSYNIENTYYWGEVVGISSQPVTHDTQNDDNLYHYIEVTKTSGKYDGSLTGISPGNECVMLGNKTKPERQTAIYSAAYTPSSGAYDRDLLAPFIIYYEGINPSSNDGFDLSAYKVQWWSSGSRTTGIPQNKMVGEFYLSAGKTIQDYIDENIKDAGISIAQLHGGSDLWMINTQSNYTISTNQRSQTWNTYVNITINGNSSIFVDPLISTPEAFLVETGIDAQTGNPYVTETALNLGTDYNFAAHLVSSTFVVGYDIFLDLYELTNNGHALNAWTGNDETTRLIRFKFQYYKDDTYTTTDTINYDIQLNKLAKGANGSAATIDQDEYFLCPVKENCYVDKDGKMLLDAQYTLKHISTDNQGHTVINTQENLSTVNYTVDYVDNENIKTGTLTKDDTNNNYNILISNYLNNTPYQQLTNKPIYITINLKDGNTIIDKRQILVVFLAGSVFDVKEDAITLAVQGSNAYTDGKVSGVDNRISSLVVDITGIRGQVSSLETEYNDLNGVVATKASTSELTTTANNINLRVTNVQSELQDNIDDVDGKFGNYYDKTTTQGLINVAASGVYLGVRQDINGDLSETGIDITNKKITINSENTDFLGNINLYNPNEGLALYDVSGTARVGIYNNPVTANDNLWEALYDNKTESKNTNTQQIFTHTRIPLGMMTAGTLTITKTSMQVLRNYQQIPVAGCAVSYTVYRGTTSVKTGNFTDNQITKQNGYAIINNLFENTDISTTTANYYITLTITYTFTEAVAGDLTSIVSLYRGYSSDDTIQMIGTDGVIFRSGYEKQLKVGNTIEAKNYGNLISIEQDGIYRTIPELTTEEHRWQWAKGDISSSYPYIEVAQNYIAQGNDAIIQCNAKVTVTLQSSNDFIGKEYLILDTTGNNPKIETDDVTGAPIHLNGDNSSKQNIEMTDRWAMYRCVRFPAAWIITT